MRGGLQGLDVRVTPRLAKFPILVPTTNPLHTRCILCHGRPSSWEQLVLRATAEEEISFDKGATLLNVPLLEFQQKLSEFL